MTCKTLTTRILGEQKKKAKASKNGGQTSILFKLFILLIVLGIMALMLRLFCGDGRCGHEWCKFIFPTCKPQL